jgi:threonine/homoserine/homoserine lactone efflux protein
MSSLAAFLAVPVVVIVTLGPDTALTIRAATGSVLKAAFRSNLVGSETIICVSGTVVI